MVNEAERDDSYAADESSSTSPPPPSPPPGRLLQGIDNLALNIEDESQLDHHRGDHSSHSMADTNNSHDNGQNTSCSNSSSSLAPTPSPPPPPPTSSAAPAHVSINLQRSHSVVSSASSSAHSVRSLAHTPHSNRRIPLLKSSYSCREVITNEYSGFRPNKPNVNQLNNNNNNFEAGNDAHRFGSGNQLETVAKTENKTRCIEISRNVLDLETFGHKAGFVSLERDIDKPPRPPPANVCAEKLKSICRDLVTCRCASSLFPILEWLPRYPVRKNLPSDIMAGITIAILHIPQGIAYSLLAGLGPVNGLYVSLYPVLIYTLMGTSHHISLGTFAIASIMLNSIAIKNGAVNGPVPTVVFDTKQQANLTGSSTAAGGQLFGWTASAASLGPPTTLEVLTSVCLLCGFIQIAMGVLRLGSLSKMLSEQLVSAFSTAIAFHVATAQLAHIFGLPHLPRVPSGPLKLIRTWIAIGNNMNEMNVSTLLLSLFMITTLVVFKEVIEPRLKKLNSYPIPIDLLLVVFSILLSWLAKFNKTFAIQVVKDVPTGLPQPSVPRFDLMSSLFVDSLILSIVCFAVSLSLAKIYAKKFAYTVRPNQELLALGTANLFSSFFLCYPSSAALSRTTLQARVGGKTQLAGLVSCALVLTVLLFLAPFLYHLPKCTLACIILVALKGMFMQIGEFPTFWRISKLDGFAWLITFVSTLVLDIDLGLIVGIVVAILTLIVRLAIPKIYSLGQLSATEIYAENEAYRNLDNYPGIRIIRFGSPLFYLNADTFKEKIIATIKSFEPNNSHRVSKTLILDLGGVSFIDKTGIDSLVEVVRTLQDEKICASFVNCPYHLISSFETIYFGDRVANVAYPFKIYPTIHDAVIDAI